MFRFIRSIFRLLCNIRRAGNDILDELNEKLDEHHDDVQEAKKYKDRYDGFYTADPKECIDNAKKSKRIKRIDNWDVNSD